MALHVRGVVLPDDEVADLWLLGDRVTREPVAGATTISDGGFILPGLVDAHCHIGIAPGSRAVYGLDEARALAAVDRDAGVLAIRDAGSPYPYPQLDADPGVPRLARAGQHVAPVRRYLRGIGVEVDAWQVAPAVTQQAKEGGNGWVKLVGDWIDRDLAIWPPPGMPARWPVRSPPRTRPAPASPRTPSARSRWPPWWRPASTASSTAPGSPRASSARWRDRVRRWYLL